MPSHNTASVRFLTVWTGSEMIVGGGMEGGQDVARGGRYDAAAATWAEMSRFAAPSPRITEGAVWADGQMLIWGGMGERDADDLLVVHRYSPDKDRWQRRGTAEGAPSGSLGPGLVWTGSEMIAWGGQDPALPGPPPVAIGARYDPARDAWTPLPDDGAPSARVAHAAFWTGTEMIVWGGADASSDPRGDGARYCPP